MFQENGLVNERLEPIISLKLANGLQIDCLIDTGFYGTLFIPREIVEKCNFEIGDKEFLQAAENQVFEVDTATIDVIWLGDNFSITVYITDSDDILLGSEMLIDAKLEIDYKDLSVKITK